ncbi:MAG: cystathionine beta-lyase, partial [Methyloligellaceae bacterium]
MSKSKKPGKASAKGHRIETRLTHLGSNPFDNHGFVNPPLYRGSTILFPTKEAYASRAQDYTYGRRGTP